MVKKIKYQTMQYMIASLTNAAVPAISESRRPINLVEQVVIR